MYQSPSGRGCPWLQEESKLVFVPGTSDAGPAAILPRPPLPEPLIADARELLPNAVFASNPCRIRFYNQAYTSFSQPGPYAPAIPGLYSAVTCKPQCKCCPVFDCCIRLLVRLLPLPITSWTPY